MQNAHSKQQCFSIPNLPIFSDTELSLAQHGLAKRNETLPNLPSRPNEMKHPRSPSLHHALDTKHTDLKNSSSKVRLRTPHLKSNPKVLNISARISSPMTRWRTLALYGVVRWCVSPRLWMLWALLRELAVLAFLWSVAHYSRACGMVCVEDANLGSFRKLGGADRQTMNY